MRSEQVWVQTDAGNPFTEKTSVLSGRQASVRPTPTGKQIVAWFLACSLHVVVDGLPRCLGQLEPHRATRFLLPDRSPVSRISTRRNVIDLERDDIATAELAVDGEIEQSEVTETTFDLELCPDRPDVLRAEWRLRSDDLALVPGDTFACCRNDA